MERYNMFMDWKIGYFNDVTPAKSICSINEIAI